MEHALTVICLFVVLPAMVLWYLDRQRRLKDDAVPGAAQSLQELAHQAQRMEQRIKALEKLLDTEAPGWRKHDDE